VIADADADADARVLVGGMQRGPWHETQAGQGHEYCRPGIELDTVVPPEHSRWVRDERLRSVW
jgi:hypothetical protein